MLGLNPDIDPLFAQLASSIQFGFLLICLCNDNNNNNNNNNYHNNDINNNNNNNNDNNAIHYCNYSPSVFVYLTLLWKTF